LDVRVGVTSDPIWRNLVDLAAPPNAVFTFKANLLPRAVGEFCAQADSLGDGIMLQAHAGTGIVIGNAGADLSFARAEKLMAQMQEHASQAQGNVVLLRCPPAWKASLPLWGRPRGDQLLMRRVRAALDPHGIFNPGRFLGGN
jgi:FAD/FMN-containing dehydrogenase